MTRKWMITCIIFFSLSFVMANCGPRVSKNDLRFARIYIETAQSHFINGNFIKAEHEARRALEITPDDAEAHRILALAAFKLRKLPISMQHIKKAIEIDPQCGDYHNDLGGFYKYQQKYSQALIEFNVAFEDKAFRAPAATMYNIAETYRAMNDMNAAQKHYRKSLDIDPNQDRSYYQLALIAKDDRDMDLAINMFEEGLKVNNNNYLILKELCLYYCSNGYEKGTKRFCTLFLQKVPANYDDPYALDRAKRCLYDYE